MLRDSQSNPFNITKAVDLSDQEISDTWVDLPGKGSLITLANPRSEMPMILLGGKGSGRTHLLRYFSYPVQAERHGQAHIEAGVRKDGYLGIYSRCEGLNASRFAGSTLSEDAWVRLFAYYMDLWLAQITIETLTDFLQKSALAVPEEDLCRELLTLLDSSGIHSDATLNGVRTLMRDIQRTIDDQINNAPLRRSPPNVLVRSRPGQLVFGIPRAFRKHLTVFEDVIILYLLDELENLTAAQQRYVNTLIREKEYPVSIKVGSRVHGLRTLVTLSGGEENREGSEFERISLDHHLRTGRGRYSGFARNMVIKRLEAAGFALAREKAKKGRSTGDLRVLLDSKFALPPKSAFEQEATLPLVAKYDPLQRPYFDRLRRKLSEGLEKQVTPLVGARVDEIIEDLAVPQYPLLEKANVFMLYQDWYQARDLVAAAKKIRRSCDAYLKGRTAGQRHKTILGHFKADLFAQLLAETKHAQRYLGLDTFIAMSAGLPRNLLITLKFVYRWSLFNGEDPFGTAPISQKSQQQGALQAANWFFDDARTVGSDAGQVQAAVERLAGLFRVMRFADKPVEPSLIAFSFAEEVATPVAARTMAAAEENSLLIKVVGGHKNRNTRRVETCYELNPMLTPRFDLPTGRRGVQSLTAAEVNAIFDPEHAADFDRHMRARVARMTAPDFEEVKVRERPKNEQQKSFTFE